MLQKARKIKLLCMGGLEEDHGLPTRQVTLTQPFKIMRTPVTQWQWAMVMNTLPTVRYGSMRQTPLAIDIRGRSIPMMPDHPAVEVSWSDAEYFIARLNKMSKDDDPLIHTLIPDHHMRARYALPTEAQWEYAARAGTQTRFYFGDDESELIYHAWCSNNLNGTQEVAQLRPNPWGLYDMYGNVWEWVADRHGKYPASDQQDPKGPKSGSDRVIRGGAWNHVERLCCSAYRSGRNLDTRRSNLGFRLVRVVH